MSQSGFGKVPDCATGPRFVPTRRLHPGYGFFDNVENVLSYSQREAIVPVIDAVYPFARAAEAHARLEASTHVGKLVLTPG